MADDHGRYRPGAVGTGTQKCRYRPRAVGTGTHKCRYGPGVVGTGTQKRGFYDAALGLRAACLPFLLKVKGIKCSNVFIVNKDSKTFLSIVAFWK